MFLLKLVKKKMFKNTMYLPTWYFTLFSKFSKNFFFITESIIKKNVILREAQDLNIEVVDPFTFFDALEKEGKNAIDIIVEKNIAPWGANVN